MCKDNKKNNKAVCW